MAICSCSFAPDEQVVVFQPILGVLLSPLRYIIPYYPSRPSLGESYIVIYSSFFDLSKHFSLFGAISRNASLLSSYAYYLARATGIQLVLDVVQLILFFRQSRETLIKNCIDGSTDTEVQNICNNEFNASKWSVVVGMVVGLIIQFCGFHFFCRHEMGLTV